MQFEDSMIYLLTEIGLSPGGRSTVHIYTQTIHRTIQNDVFLQSADGMFCVQSEVSMLFLKSKDDMFFVHYFCLRLQYLRMASALSLQLHKASVQFRSYLGTS